MKARQLNRVCILCNKLIHTDHGFFANNNRSDWTFAHALCREMLMLKQQYAVLNAIREIGFNIRRTK